MFSILLGIYLRIELLDYMVNLDYPGGSDSKETAYNTKDPWVRKIPLRRERLPAPVFLPGEVHGQRSLEACSPWGCKEAHMTE